MIKDSTAFRTLWVECPKRGGFEIEIIIGTPYEISDSEWACAIKVHGLYDNLRDQHGVDSWQALMLAQRLAKTLLQGFVEDGGRLFDCRGGSAVGVTPLFDGGVLSGSCGAQDVAG